MNWISIGLAGAIGALAALIAQLMVRKPKERWVAYTLVLISSFAVMYTLSRLYILPVLNTWKYQKNLEMSLQGIPAYQQISRYDPDAYQRINAEIQKLLKTGRNESKIIEQIRQIVGELVQKYLPRASDDALLSYMGVVTQEIEELASQSPELCFKFLFPQQYGAIDVRKYIRPETQKADLDALAEVIRTGAEDPINVEDFEGYNALIGKVITNLHAVYGDDTLLLQNPHVPEIDKEKFCKLTVALYREILKLPKQECSFVLRYMLSSK